MSGGGAPSNTTSSTTTELPAWAQPYAQSLLSRGAALSDNPMPVYQGQRTANMNGAQTQGMQMVQNRAQDGSGIVNAGQQNVQDTLGGKFMEPGSNPYLSSAIDTASQGVMRNYNGAVQGNDATMARAGAFGGSAWQQGQQGAQHELANGLGNIATNMSMQNYGNERQNQIGAQQTALQYGQQPYNDAAQLMGAGATQFGYDQQKLTDQQNLFNENAAAPYKSLDVLGNTIRGAVGGGGTTTQTAPGANPYAQAAGGAAALYGLLK
jgi:hypothetical protein